jgi:tetratricopeptide (TPR) repeat protein
MRNYGLESKWLQHYYTENSKATNVDLFNLGIAYYKGGNFVTADSVFGIYIQKYPEQTYGYYWQAKNKALQDKEMKEGLAVPVYQQLADLLEKKPEDQNYKSWLTEAYAYMAAYQANTLKNFAEAIKYFEKLLTVDPGNADAIKYIAVLSKHLGDNPTKQEDDGIK